MAGAKIEFDQAQVDDIRGLLAEIKNGAERAMRTSINRTVTACTAQVAQELTAKVTLKSTLIKDTLTQKKASLNNLSGRVGIPYQSVPLAAFSTTPSASTGLKFGDNTSNGVLVKVWKDKPSQRFSHAFFAMMSNGYIGLYDRRNAKTGIVSPRLPIYQLKGPSLPTVYQNTPGLAPRVEQTSAERLLRELESNVNYLLQKQASQIADA